MQHTTPTHTGIQEDYRVNFRTRITTAVMMLAMFLVVVGCGRSDDLQQARQDRDQVSEQASTAARNLDRTLSELREQNRELRTQIQLQDRQLEQLAIEINRLREATGVVAARADAEREAQRTTGPIMRFFQLLLFLILVVVIAYFIWKLLRPKPFEDDEDDDFSSFDDDFGFDDEDDDFGDLAEEDGSTEADEEEKKD